MTKKESYTVTGQRIRKHKKITPKPHCLVRVDEALLDMYWISYDFWNVPSW